MDANAKVQDSAIMQANTELTETQHEQLHQTLKQYFALFQGADYQKEITPEAINAIVHSNILFKDPFQRINGHQDFCQLLNHFHHSVKDARFLIEAIFEHPERDNLHNRHYLVKWRFSGRLKRIGLWQFPGVSEIEQDEDGLITHHTDYWDAGEHFYEKLPFFGRIVGWIKAKVANAVGEA